MEEDKYRDGVDEGEEWGSDEVDHEGKDVGIEGGRREGRFEKEAEGDTERN